jgi:hypothetical protein
MSLKEMNDEILASNRKLFDEPDWNSSAAVPKPLGRKGGLGGDRRDSFRNSSINRAPPTPSTSGATATPPPLTPAASLLSDLLTPPTPTPSTSFSGAIPDKTTTGLTLKEQQDEINNLIAAAQKTHAEKLEAELKAKMEEEEKERVKKRKREEREERRKEKDKERKEGGTDKEKEKKEKKEKLSEEEKNANKEKRLQKLVGAVVMKELQPYVSKIGKDAFKEHAKQVRIAPSLYLAGDVDESLQITKKISDREKQEDGYEHDRLESLGESKTVKIVKYTKAYVEKHIKARKVSKSGSSSSHSKHHSSSKSHSSSKGTAHGQPNGHTHGQSNGHGQAPKITPASDRTPEDDEASGEPSRMEVEDEKEIDDVEMEGLGDIEEVDLDMHDEDGGLGEDEDQPRSSKRSKSDEGLDPLENRTGDRGGMEVVSPEETSPKETHMQSVEAVAL